MLFKQLNYSSHLLFTCFNHLLSSYKTVPFPPGLLDRINMLVRQKIFNHPHEYSRSSLPAMKRNHAPITLHPAYPSSPIPCYNIWIKEKNKNRFIKLQNILLKQKTLIRGLFYCINVCKSSKNVG